ncbi:MAG: [FeFe] hydrogenase H-cluster maturation GTPase HydF, partial [Lentisphaeria bacterium]|nr:[FeFe] hydrogenase H-cluster maturation GTPase HydF [Lentisphaeria bacterium]
HCGACMFNRREVLSRILQCGRQNVPFTNYGVAIAGCFGILERALQPFPDALAAYRQAAGERT